MANEYSVLDDPANWNHEISNKLKTGDYEPVSCLFVNDPKPVRVFKSFLCFFKHIFYMLKGIIKKILSKR